MQKKISKLLFLVVLIFATFSFSLNSFAYESNGNLDNGQIISASDSLDNSYLTRDVSGYKDGQIISTSNSLEGPADIVGKDDVKENSGATISADDSITPYGWFQYKDKTIEVYYASFSSIPETYYYDEYSGEYLYDGHLPLVKTVKTSTGWTATFSGKLKTWVN